MARISNIRRMTVSIEIEYTPNRLSDENLAGAYELALPLVSREVSQMQKQQKHRKRVPEESKQMSMAVINE